MTFIHSLILMMADVGEEQNQELEIEETRNLNNEYGNDTYRHLCRMVRAWKNHAGAKCSGLWIDTLSYNFPKTI